MTSSTRITRADILLDTNVVSYLFRQDTQAEFFRPFFVNKALAVSFMTAAELYFGAYRSRWGVRRVSRLGNFLRNFVMVPFDHGLTQEWARLRVENQAKGHDISHADAWIAATARLHNCALATNNPRHFMATDGLILLAPPSGEGA